MKYSVIILILAAVAYPYWKARRRYVTLIDQIPGPPIEPWFPFLGHAMLVLHLDRANFEYGTYSLVYQMVASVNQIFRQEGICKMWIGLKPLVLLYRPDDVEVILSSNTLTQKSAEYRFLDPWLGEGLVTSARQKWRIRRKILTPAFHFRILEDFLPIINEQSNILISKLDRDFVGGPFDCVPVVTLCMLDIICETAMGIKMNLQENHTNHEYVEALYNISHIFLTRLMRPWLWPQFTFNLSEHGKIFNSSVNKTKEFALKVIKERRQEWVEYLEAEEAENKNNNNNNNDDSHSIENNNEGAELSKENVIDDYEQIKQSSFFTSKRNSSSRLAFLDLLLQHHLVSKNLTLEDVREEVDTFMFAGHDTTSHAISWTLYMLGLHPDVQQRVCEEVDHAIDAAAGGDISNLTVDDIKSLKYLECVLKEVQRIYPTAPFIGRELSEDTVINKYLIPKGTTVGIFTYVLHRDEEMFPNPEKFDPDRFLPKNCNGRHPYSFIPFSAGPRNCIGQKFAMMEQKIVIAKILRHFNVRAVDPRDRLVIVGEMILRSLNGLRLELTRRKFNV